jgi:hypothetical protein
MRRAPPKEAISDEENYCLLGISLIDKEAPNKESMVETDKV